jgi:hypothetical protein
VKWQLTLGLLVSYGCSGLPEEAPQGYSNTSHGSKPQGEQGALLSAALCGLCGVNLL